MDSTRESQNPNDLFPGNEASRVDRDTPALLALLDNLKAAHDRHYAQSGYLTWKDGGPHPVAHYTAEVGPRYVRISRMEDYSTGCQDRRKREGDAICGIAFDEHPKTHDYQFGGGSVVCFVDRQDGNIYYPKGWKGPQKNFARGNVFTGNAWITPSGGIGTAR